MLLCAMLALSVGGGSALAGQGSHDWNTGYVVGQQRGVSGVAGGALSLDFSASKFVVNGRLASTLTSAPGAAFSRTGSAFGLYSGSGLAFSSGLPRIVNGVLLDEASAATNIDTVSEQPTGYTLLSATMTTDTAAGPYGTTTFYSLITSTAASGNAQKNFTVANDSSSYVRSAFVKKSTTQTALIEVGLVGGTGVTIDCAFDLSTGVLSINTNSQCTVEDYGTAWRVDVQIANNSTGNTTLFTKYRPVNGGTGSADFGGFQLEKGPTTASAYIPTSSVSVTRNAETLSVALPSGFYATKVADPTGSTWNGPQKVTGSLAISPRSGKYMISSATACKLDFADLYDRADTSAGVLGTSSSGAVYTMYGAYAGGYPLPAATTGQIISNRYVSPPASVVYAAIVLGSSIHHIEAVFRYDNSTAHASAETGAFIFSPSPNYIDTMVHITFNSNQMLIQKRLSGGSFITLATLTYSSIYQGTTHVARCDLINATVTCTMDAAAISATDPDLATLAGPYTFFEHFSTDVDSYPLQYLATGAAYAPCLGNVAANDKGRLTALA